MSTTDRPTDPLRCCVNANRQRQRSERKSYVYNPHTRLPSPPSPALFYAATSPFGWRRAGPRKTGGVVTEIRFFARPLCAAIRLFGALSLELRLFSRGRWRRLRQFSISFRPPIPTRTNAATVAAAAAAEKNANFPCTYTESFAFNSPTQWCARLCCVRERDGRWFRLVHDGRRVGLVWSVQRERDVCLLGLQIVSLFAAIFVSLGVGGREDSHCSFGGGSLGLPSGGSRATNYRVLLTTALEK